MIFTSVETQPTVQLFDLFNDEDKHESFWRSNRLERNFHIDFAFERNYYPL